MMSGELSGRSEKPGRVEGARDPGPGFDAPPIIISCMFWDDFLELLDAWFLYKMWV